MSEDAIILIWFGIAGIVGLNGCAAGLAAVLHIWRRAMPGGSKAIWAALASGFLPASVFIPMSIVGGEFVLGEEPFVIAIAFALVLAGAMLISLPGALLVTRKLDAPRDEFRAFE